jgi:hypothetical protein
MNELSDITMEESCTLLALDDACLVAILRNLSAQQLRAAGAVCTRLLAISRANSLWIKHIRETFGLSLVNVKGVQQAPCAAFKLYSRCVLAAAASSMPYSPGYFNNGTTSSFVIV